jgi:hypothetical protein
VVRAIGDLRRELPLNTSRNPHRTRFLHQCDEKSLGTGQGGRMIQLRFSLAMPSAGFEFDGPAAIQR